MQSVNLVRVFIASPSYVTPERDAAVTVTHEWNAAYSFQQRVAIEAVRMETHAQAALGCHPQELINGQLLGRMTIRAASREVLTHLPSKLNGNVRAHVPVASARCWANVSLALALMIVS